MLAQRTITRRGNALLLVMGLLIALATMATSLTELAVGNHRLHEERKVKLKITVAAESGANLAVAWFEKNWITQSANMEGAHPPDLVVPLGSFLTSEAETYATEQGTAAPDGFTVIDANTISVNGEQITASISKLSGTNARESVYQLTSIATHGDRSIAETYRRQRVQLTFYPIFETSSIYAQSLLTLAGYDFGGNASTDSWSSRLDIDGDGLADITSALQVYDSSDTTDDHGDLVSTGTITQSGSSVVNGDTHSNADVSIDRVDYNGLRAAKAAAIGIDTSYGSVSSSQTFGTIGSETAYELDALSLGNRDVITIRGDVTLFVDGEVSFGSGNGNRFDLSQGSVTIIQSDYDGDAVSHANSTFNGNAEVGAMDVGGVHNAHDPTKFIFKTDHDGDIKFNGTAEMCGIFYAPRATMKLTGTFDMFGAMVVGAMQNDQVTGTPNFHYDEALADLTSDPDPTPSLVVSAWRTSSLGFGVE